MTLRSGALLAALAAGTWGAVRMASATPTSTSTSTSTPTPTPTPTSTSTSTSTSTPPPLPHPLPPPGQPPPSVPSERDDPLDLLWSHRLHFAPGGAPLVTIRLMEGQGQLVFRSRARAKLRVRGGGTIELAAGEPFRVRATGALPAVFAHHPLLAEAVQADHARLAAARRLWEERGVTIEQRQVGGVYGIAGRVVDNRRIVVLAAGDGSEGFAREFAEQALELYGSRTGTFSEVLRRPSGRLEVLDAAGNRLASADALATLEVEGGAGFSLAAVEHDVGHATHGFEDRAYRGRLHVTLDASGRLAAVLELPLEELLRGLVPSEIPAGSPREALRAQAVTARSNVLAQLGTRHLGDPYGLCSDVHCQAYRGETAQAAATDQAVRDTGGEALFGRVDRTLVDAVYSALCGGHGEDNEAVWSTLPDPNLRGRPDLPPEASTAWEGGLRDEARLESFLRAAPNAWCARARGVRKDRYRWERRFAPAELDRLAVPLAVGHVSSLEVTSRGVSGRARSLVVTGDAGRGTVEGELRIRQLLGNLPSAMFVVDRDGEATVLRGGGWGHGAGMCQWGAIGRAEAGQAYREILRAYYAGAEVAKIY